MLDDIESLETILDSMLRGTNVEGTPDDIAQVLTTLVHRGLVHAYEFRDDEGYVIVGDERRNASSDLWYFPSHAGDRAYETATGRPGPPDRERGFPRA